MTQIGKTGVVVCTHCRKPCSKERISYTHSKDRKEVHHEFCSEECRDEELGINARGIEKVERQVRDELNLLHRYICPSCIRRLRKFI